ncbi:MAG TPA: LON peptidase substrate-binding domain-containing protein [Candidatus Eremiobacteraceae bacterium]|nr:LON peptidase substrate-binding domain-containing protein [Candidatus Eremiobacteraceae bacterium]
MKHSLDLFPLRTVLVPGSPLHLHVFEDRYKTMIGACIERGMPFGVVLDRAGKETGDELDPARTGTLAEIRDVTYLSAGRLFVVSQGLRRFRVERFTQTKPFWKAEVEYLGETAGPARVAARLRSEAAERMKDYIQALLRLSGHEGDIAIELPESAAASSFIIADTMQIDVEAKQTLLECPTASQRLTAELELLERETRRLRARSADPSEDDEPSRAASTLRIKISLN